MWQVWSTAVRLLPSGEGAQTSCADVYAAVLTINHHPFALDVGPEHALGCPHGVAPILAKHRAFAANFTLRHVSPRLYNNLYILPQGCWKAT